MIKLLYQPVSMLVSVPSGVLAGPSRDYPVAVMSAMITAASAAGPS
jgi:hypothetical protein